MAKARLHPNGIGKFQYGQWLRATPVNSNGNGDKSYGGRGHRSQATPTTWGNVEEGETKELMINHAVISP